MTSFEDDRFQDDSFVDDGGCDVDALRLVPKLNQSNRSGILTGVRTARFDGL